LNSKALSLIKNFSYTLTSNLLSLLVSALVVVVVPKLIGVEEYGYWQLYLFYSSYVGFMHFGWNDGIYLRYGGKEYKELDRSLFFSQFYMLVILQLIIAIIIFVIANSLIVDGSKLFIIKMTAICMIILNSRLMLLFILQSPKRDEALQAG
jgi:O-antigen/teichoic acid export membrane protein